MSSEEGLISIPLLKERVKSVYCTEYICCPKTQKDTVDDRKSSRASFLCEGSCGI